MARSPDEATFDLIRASGTNGINYEITTDDVGARLREWKAQCEYEVIEIKHDALSLRFLTLPDDLDKFAREIYEFCPDVFDQHFGCVNEMLEACEESGNEVSAYWQDMVAGLDPEDEDFGLELLKRSLARHQTLGLWWD